MSITGKDQEQEMDPRHYMSGLLIMDRVFEIPMAANPPFPALKIPIQAYSSQPERLFAIIV